MTTRHEFRDYAEPKRDTVAAFYELNHRYQSLAFARAQQRRLATHPENTRRMTWLQTLAYLDTLKDDSDPDTEASQLQHLLQCAGAIRADGHDDWFVLAGFIHDVGKILCLTGEPQWAVVGDTFPVGCRFSDQIVYPKYFASNPDILDEQLQTDNGIYEAGCGLKQVQMSWGHDEYLFQCVKPYLPEPALYMIRYHSFYAWHEAGAYGHLCDDHDRAMLPWVKKFNAYDLYTKADEPVSWSTEQSYYIDLIERYLPASMDWPV